MTRKLFILRHAKSDWNAGTADDFHRPLAGRGLRDAPRMGRWMKDHNLVPDLILSSPAVRARQTVEAVVDESGISKDHIRFDDRLYLADTDTLLQVLRECPDGVTGIMMVGHNPGLEELLENLVRTPAPRNKNGKLLTTAALAELETDCSWQRLEAGEASLKRLQYPRDLKDR